MTVNRKEMLYRTMVMLMIFMEVCWGTDPPKSYGPPPPNDNNYQNIYDAEFQRPLAVFTEKPINIADFVLVPVVQVPSSDLRVIYRPQIDSVSKTEPIVMCKSSTKSFEATPAVQVPLQQPFYLYDERTLIPFPKTVTIVHGGYRMSIPVAVVVAPVPVGVLRSGPVYVTTLYAIPVGPVLLPTPVPVRYVPWTPYPSDSPAPPPQSPAKNSKPNPPSYSAPPSPPSPQSPPSSSYPPSPPSGPSYPAPPSPPTSPLYPRPAPSSPPLYQRPIPPPPPPPPSYPQLPPPPSYSQPLPSPPSYSQPAPPPLYSQPAPPSPTYYQNYSEDVDPPGKLYTQFVASSPFQNSKESPVLNQIREESEKNRNKYSSPSYYNQYQTIDA